MKPWVKNLYAQGLSIEQRAKVLDAPIDIIRRMYAGDETALDLVVSGKASRSGKKMWYPAWNGSPLMHKVNLKHEYPAKPSAMALIRRGWWRGYLARAGINCPAEAVRRLGADPETARRWFDDRLNPMAEIRVKRPVCNTMNALLEKSTP